MSFLKHLLPGWKTDISDRTKPNAAILSALEDEIKDAEAEAIGSKVLMSLKTSTGEWLNKYGNIFGVLRRDNELDEAYRSRISDYILLERGTIPAIKQAIRTFFQDSEMYVDVYEPYKNIFFLNRSKLNGPDHLLGHYYTVAVIDIKIAAEFPPELIGIIKEFKPAGVTVHLTTLDLVGGTFGTTSYDTEISGGTFSTTQYDIEFNGGAFS
jgi:hypothetical protein